MCILVTKTGKDKKRDKEKDDNLDDAHTPRSGTGYPCCLAVPRLTQAVGAAVNTGLIVYLVHVRGFLGTSGLRFAPSRYVPSWYAYLTPLCFSCLISSVLDVIQIIRDPHYGLAMTQPVSI